ncbi:MAG: hypothetical protein RIS76_4046 [Verrucomicrobiota bacterium]|jgi:Putative prokaryotic signal transducing protein
MEWVPVSKLFNPAEADMLRSRLEAAGFTVSLKNMGAALAIEGYSMAAGGIWVQVPMAEASEAQALVDACRDSRSGSLE